MIVEKKKNKPNAQEEIKTEQIQIPKNGLIAVYHAIKDILEQVRWDYYDINSEKIFKTVAMNRGQFERIVRKGGNSEYALGFPAAFIEFVNWRYLVQQQRINDGRADMQIKFVMNRLNNQDPDTFNEDGTVKEYRETEVEYVAQIINQFIQELKVNYPALSERVNLKYIDPLESFDDSLQPCWITYEVWFKEENINATRFVKDVYVVFPPYTNHTDWKEDYGKTGHTNFDHPALHKDHSKFIYTDGLPTPEPAWPTPEDWEMPIGGEKEIDDDTDGTVTEPDTGGDDTGGSDDTGAGDDTGGSGNDNDTDSQENEGSGG